MSNFQCKLSVDNSIMSGNKLAYIILLTKFPRRMMETEKAYFLIDLRNVENEIFEQLEYTKTWPVLVIPSGFAA